MKIHSDKTSKQSFPINKLHTPDSNSQKITLVDQKDLLIDELENKLSLIKLENSLFFEDVDTLNDELIINEQRNKVKISHI